MEEVLIRAGLPKGRYRIEPSQGLYNDQLVVDCWGRVVARFHESQLRSGYIVELK